jgi:SAM-dependent methyltransferase
MIDPPPDPYAAIPAFYDLEHAAFDDDLTLYLNIAQAVGDPILELGSGTGRVLLPLVEAGFRVTGLDSSRAMLDRADQAVRAAGLQSLVTLHEGEMAAADAAPGGPFGLVLAPLNALLHLVEPGAQRRALEAARRALDPRGQLVVDVFNPTPDALRGFDRGVVHEGSWAGEDGARIDKFGARRLHAAEQRIETDLWYDETEPGGTVRRTRSRFPMRYLHRAELELLLELAGFPEWEIYGSYDLDPFDDASERLLVLAEATPSRR